MGFIKDYLSFTKKERTGITVLFILIVVFSLMPFLFPLLVKKEKMDTSNFEAEIESLNLKRTDSNNKNYQNNFEENSNQHYYSQSPKKYESEIQGELFYFDPNTASTNDWKRLGLPEKTIGTIQHYISKGGKFYKPDDIRKIWGIPEELADRLVPYIQIEKSFSKKEFSNKLVASPNPDKHQNTPSILDINLADTTALIALPGIGSKLANRIIAFREKLGGFYKVEQIAETYGLPDSTFQKIKARFFVSNSLSITKININTASVDILKSHPYIRYGIANAIIQYRNQHGNFNQIDDIKKIMLVTEELYNKIFPYLKISEDKF